MPTVRVSPKFQVVIPEAVRRQLDLKPGQELDVWADGPVIKLVPVRPVEDFRGAFPGIDTSVPRDDDRP
ncbi:MAG: AbrB/MazE/SpoVT family DNA-binding domain-containing protein [Acidobacteriota bacterium]